MKKTTKLLLLMIMIFLLVGCKSRNPDVTMEIKNGTLTTKGATIVIRDYSNQETTYGEWFRIEKKEGNTWKELTPITKDYMFNMIGYHVNENHELILEVDWEFIYGSLKPGLYKLIKQGPNDTLLETKFIIES